MQQSQLKAAVTLIKVTSTSPQEDAVNSGKGGHSSRENRRSKEKKKKNENRGDFMSGTNGGALPAQGRAELGMGRDFGAQGRGGGHKVGAQPCEG